MVLVRRITGFRIEDSRRDHELELYNLWRLLEGPPWARKAGKRNLTLLVDSLRSKRECVDLSGKSFGRANDNDVKSEHEAK
jgi:hypothetical protein